MVLIRKHLEFYGIIVEMNWLYNGDRAIIGFTAGNTTTDSFKTTAKITGETSDNGT